MNKEKETPLNEETPEIENTTSVDSIENSENLESKENEQEINLEESTKSASNEKIEKLEKELGESKEKYLYLYSEYDNYKRRTQKERIDLLKTGGEDVFKLMLPLIDDFDRAMKANETAEDMVAVKEGLNLIYNKMTTSFVQDGLIEMKCVGEQFNSDTMEALTNISAPTDDLKGKVIEVIEKGYLLKGKVIRCAKVIVGN